MSTLWLMMVRACGWMRPAVIVAGTAVASGLLLVAGSILLLPLTRVGGLFALVGEPGLRYGTFFAIALLSLPVLLLVAQAIRLGQASRAPRLAAIRMVGATPRQVGHLAGLDAGVPAAVGSLLGLVVYGVLRNQFGGADGGGDPSGYGPGLARALVPTSVAPTWWMVLLVVLVLGSLGYLAGARAAVRTTGEPGTPPQPRAWGVVALAAAPLALVGAITVEDRVAPPRAGDSGVAAVLAVNNLSSTLGAILAVAMAVTGLVLLAPWVGHRLGLLAQRSARTPATLMAARQLVMHPGAAGRAGAAAAAIGLVIAGGVLLWWDATEFAGVDDSLAPSMMWVAVAAGTALLATVASLALHSTDTVLEQRRSIAVAVATGVPVATLRLAQRRTVQIAVLIPAVAVTLLAATAFALLAMPQIGARALVPSAAAVLAVATPMWAAVWLATTAVSPLISRAADPASLRWD